MKNKFIFGFICFLSVLGYSQSTIDLTLKYNSSQNRYEVFARPNFSQANFTWGPSQISVVLPSISANQALAITSVNTTSGGGGGIWSDFSLIYAPSSQPQNDFHGVGSFGAITNLVANQETLLFSFVLPEGCLPGVRLFNNGVDPNSSQPGMGGGDFSNTIDNGILTDVYNVNYNNNGSNCIDAVNDSPSVITGSNGATGVVNVFDNDTLSGSPLNPNDVVLTEINPNSTDPLTLNPNGTVDVAPNTPAGTYTLTYQICEITNNLNCDTAVVTIVVEAAPIIANDDTPANPVNGITGLNNVINIYTNDTLNGVSFLPAAINYTVVSPFSNTNITVATNGNVNVAPNTSAGTYTSTYQICEALNPANCDTAIITVVVQAAPIIANDDTPANPVNGITGQNNVINIYTNDTLNGVSFLPAAINYTVVSPFSNTNITVATNGNVNVAPNTPAGTYTSIYQICEALNPTNCDTAIITVVVQAAPIIANDDTPANPVNGITGQNNVINIYTNDTLNGVSFLPAAINYTVVSPFSNTNITVATNGNVNVAPNTPAGTYTSTYQICEALNPTNCDTAIITVVVQAAPIIANDDTPANPVNGITGLNNVINIYTNDTLNGVSFLPAAINYTVVSPFSNTNITVATNGNVNVAPNTPAGTYTSTYQICEALNPANCDTAIITVVVQAAPIIANNDSPTNPVNGTDGATNVLNVFDNDTLNGVLVNPTDVILSELNPNPTNPLTLNPNGTVDVAPNTPAGTYTLDYQICEVLNPANCDNATVTVVIQVRSIVLKAMLQGSLFATTNGIMRDDLRTNNLIPSLEPYTAMGVTGNNTRFNRPDFTSNELTSNSVLSVTGNNAIVDWVFVELRDATDSSIVLHTKSALIQKDGDIVDSSDGISPLSFNGLNNNSYFVSVKHRNHLGTMSNSPISFVNTILTFDFTSSGPNLLWNESPAYQGFEQVLDISGNYALWAGNTNSDRKVKYLGSASDLNLIFGNTINFSGNSFFFYNYDFVLPIYSNADINMNAKVKYLGLSNDSTYIFYNLITKYSLSNGLYNYDFFNEQTPN